MKWQLSLRVETMITLTVCLLLSVVSVLGVLLGLNMTRGTRTSGTLEREERAIIKELTNGKRKDEVGR